MAGIDAFGATDDVAFARHLVREIGVATVPGSSFFHDKALGRQLHPLLLLQAGRDARRGDRAAAEPAGHRLTSEHDNGTWRARSGHVLSTARRQTCRGDRGVTSPSVR